MSAIKKIYNTWRGRWGKVPTALTLTLAMLLSIVAIAIAAEFVVTPSDPNHEINGAWFMQFNPEDATGTGLFNPFVRVSANLEVVQGYNTDFRPLEFEEDGSWTDSLPLSDVPYFLYEEVLYREFQLDINQTGSNPLISLDEVQIWLGGADADEITGFVEEGVETDFGTFPGFTLQEVYNLDADEDNDLILDYSYAAGSGKRDLKLLVPDEYFKPYAEACEYMGTGCEQYVVFFTQFGVNAPNNDGFEEWGVAIYNNISGYKWHDVNVNGIWDTGEPVLEDWLICAQQVYKGDDVGDPICTTTDESGKYLLPLPDGDYRIYETCPTSVNPWNQSYPTPDGACGTGVHLVTLKASPQGPQIEKDRNFGNYQGIPDIDIDKTGDTLSKIGDDVDYTITVDNTSTAGTADLYCHITDAMLGIDEYVTLAWDAPNYVIEKTYTVPESASDPMLNTASVSCTFVGDAAVQATDSDGHSVNLFQPDFSITKTGDTLSKIGDTVTYTYTITNLSSEDSPVLDLNSLVDNKIGNLTLETGYDSACNELSFEEVCTFDIDWEIPEGAADPYVNRVDAQYQVHGFPNTYDRWDTHSVNLFTADFSITKTGDTLSKIGDTVTYTYTITNLSSSDAPVLDLNSLVDDEIGDLTLDTGYDSACDVLSFGEVCTFDVDWEIPSGAADPYVNRVDAQYQVHGFSNTYDKYDTHSVNLFQPSFTFTKVAAEEYSKAGDIVHYTITLDNTSSADTPDLECTITDTMLGINQPVTLAYNAANYVINANYTVKTGDPDPLVNTANVSCSPVDFPNVLPDSDTASVDLLHPDFTLSKECMVEPVKAGAAASFEVEFKNTGDVDLVATFDEDLTGTGCPLADVPVTVGDGETLTCTVSKTADTDPGPSVVSNTVNVHVTLPAKYGLDNYWDDMAEDTCDIYAVKKGQKWNDLNADGIWDMGEPVLPGWSIQGFKWVDGAYGMSPVATVVTNAEGYYKFDMVEPGAKYAVCEVLEAGFIQTFPNVTLPAEGYVDCTQFGTQYGPVGYEIMLASGEYEVNNDFGNFKPLGCTYTQGYWKTHSIYGPAGPYDVTWELQGGGDAPFLSTAWDVGYSWYELFNTPPKGGNPYIILSYQYMAAWLNIHNVDPMKMANPTVLGTAMADAELLLGTYTPDYDFKADPDGVSAEFIMLAELLDDFNNGYLGVPHCE